MEKVPVHAIGLGFCDRDRDIMVASVIYECRARIEIPLPPGRDDLYIGFQIHICQLEPDLVVPLSG